MKTTELSKIFEIEYGQQLDFNKMTTSTSDAGVNFVTRSSKNLGIKTPVKEITGIAPYEAGLITVTLGGTYLLSAFVQPSRFYTAQNIKVLRPKSELSFNQKLFYCQCIMANRFKYSSHGREANKSLEKLLVPTLDEIPTWVSELKFSDSLLKEDYKSKVKKPYESYNEILVRLDELFDLQNGFPTSGLKTAKIKISDKFIPLIRPSKQQATSFVEYVDKSTVPEKYIYPRHSLYISTNGQGSHTYSYVSTGEFVPNSDVAVLIPRREMSLQEKLYYAKAISINRKLFSYGRKPKGEKIKAIKIPKFPPPFVYEGDLFSLAIDKS